MPRIFGLQRFLLFQFGNQTRDFGCKNLRRRARISWLRVSHFLPV